jgi:hypothetical protein
VLLELLVPGAPPVLPELLLALPDVVDAVAPPEPEPDVLDA